MVKAVFFDWDGTLFDVFDFLVEIYTKVFEEYGITPWEPYEYRTKFRTDWRGLLKDMGLNGHVDQLIQVWDESKKSKQHELTLHAGAMELLLDLKKDYYVGIVSSAPKHVLEQELERLGVMDLMDLVLSDDDTKNKKPSPTPLLVAAKNAGFDPKECLYIGDMMEDIQSANAAGMHSIAVTWGIHEKSLLEKQNPQKIVENFSELKDYIKSMP